MGRQKSTDEATLRRFINGGEELVALAEDLSEEDLALRSESDGWTVREIIHHVSDDGDVWSMCIKKALATPGALVRFEGFPGNEPWGRGASLRPTRYRAGGAPHTGPPPLPGSRAGTLRGCVGSLHPACQRRGPGGAGDERSGDGEHADGP